MQKARLIKISIAIVFLVVGMTLVYHAFFRNLVTLAYHEQAPGWFDSLVAMLYPRFEVERHRFELSLFLMKADQIILRLNFCLIAGLALFLAQQLSGKFRSALGSISKGSTEFNQFFLIRLFFLGLILYTSDWYWDFQQYAAISYFYKPILLFNLLGVSFLPNSLSLVLLVVMVGGFIGVIVNWRPLEWAVIGGLTFIFLQGFFYSFEKTDHRFATLTWVVVFMPFLIYQADRKDSRNDTLDALSLIKVALVLVYLLAGLEKLFTSGLAWMTGDTLRAYIYLHQAPLGVAIMDNSWIIQILSIMAMGFQLGFWLILFFPGKRWFFLAAGIGFHWGTFFLLNIGDLLTPWIFTYIFFVKWDFLQKYLAQIPFSFYPFNRRVSDNDKQ